MPVLSDDREGVGLGVGVGLRVGVAVGVGVGVARWACADVDASADAKAIATVIATQLAAPGFPVREGLEEPRINIIPTSSAARQKNTEISIGHGRFARSSQGASIGHGPRREPIAEHCCSAATARNKPQKANSRPRQLAKMQISCCNIRHNRIQAVRLCVS
jgi:hypothetical protein